MRNASSQEWLSLPHTSGVDDDRPPICPACGVTMVPAALGARNERVGDWVCLECEETGEPDDGTFPRALTPTRYQG